MPAKLAWVAGSDRGFAGFRMLFCKGKKMMIRKQMTVCALVLSCSQLWAADVSKLKTEKDKLSYSIGASVGKNLRVEGADIDLNLLIEGFKTSLGGQEALLTDKEVQQIMNDFQVQMRQRSTAKKQKAMGENQKNGDAYLAQYKAQKGVQSLPSGVLFKVIKEGTGNRPAETDQVEVNYRGTLINGTQFDATEPGKPATLRVAALIAGWKQALGAMPVGSKWQIVLPPLLAYGERGAGNDIGPNEVLVFDVELLAIK
jgi:FKBP-type peptidyl-prolyl cis-trans isomerase FklB